MFPVSVKIMLSHYTPIYQRPRRLLNDDQKIIGKQIKEQSGEVKSTIAKMPHLLYQYPKEMVPGAYAVTILNET